MSAIIGTSTEVHYIHVHAATSFCCNIVTQAIQLTFWQRMQPMESEDHVSPRRHFEQKDWDCSYAVSETRLKQFNLKFGR